MLGSQRRSRGLGAEWADLGHVARGWSPSLARSCSLLLQSSFSPSHFLAMSLSVSFSLTVCLSVCLSLSSPSLSRSVPAPRSSLLNVRDKTPHDAQGQESTSIMLWARQKANLKDKGSADTDARDIHCCTCSELESCCLPAHCLQWAEWIWHIPAARLPRPRPSLKLAHAMGCHSYKNEFRGKRILEGT